MCVCVYVEATQPSNQFQSQAEPWNVVVWSWWWWWWWYRMYWILDQFAWIELIWIEEQQLFMNTTTTTITRYIQFLNPFISIQSIHPFKKNDNDFFSNKNGYLKRFMSIWVLIQVNKKRERKKWSSSIFFPLIIVGPLFYSVFSDQVYIGYIHTHTMGPNITSKRWHLFVCHQLLL